MRNIATERDGFIDFFKGLLILWVIHIHTVFWSGREYIPQIIRETSLLVDVATFFFISGYLTKLANFSSFLKKSTRQFINLYSNYVVLSLLLLFPLTLFFILKDKSLPNLQLAIVSMLKLAPGGELWGDIPVYEGSLWYLRVYFSVLLLLPIFASFFGSRRLRIYVLTFFLLAFYFSRYLNWNNNFLFSQADFIWFYLFVYMLGTAYRVEEQNIHVQYLKMSLLLNVGLSIVLLFHFNGGSFEIQNLKFPLSFNYLIYSLLLIHVFAIIKCKWRYPNFTSSNKVLRFLEWCGRNVYFIYLIQGVVCSVPVAFVPVIKDDVPILVLYIVILTFNIFFTLLLTLLYTRAKTDFLNFIRVKFRKIKVESRN
jgi:hypothetical protein